MKVWLTALSLGVFHLSKVQLCYTLTADMLSNQNVVKLQGFRRRSLLRLLSGKSSIEEGPSYTPLPMC